MEIQKLVKYAAGLFIWAATIMKLLFSEHNPVKWLADFLLHDRQVITLHDLYRTALLSVSNWKAGETTDTYRRILGIIITSQVPLTDMAIADLLGLDRESRNSCSIALRRFGCVIQWSDGQPARTLHKSFPDYLTDKSACGSEPWFVDLDHHQRELTLACLRIMNDGLHFNMGDLQTSHLANVDVAALQAHVEVAISPSMLYSCRFWGHHLSKMGSREPTALASTLEFFEQKFLYWLEVLSLLGQVGSASHTLASVRKQAAVSELCAGHEILNTDHIDS